MRFKPESLGNLVRPRVVTKAVVYPICGFEDKEDEDAFWSYSKDRSRIERFAVYKKPFPILFENLKLGNTNKDLSTCYVGVITHYKINFKGQVYILNKNNVNEMLDRVRKLYGKNTGLKVKQVGLQFYKGVYQDEQGNLTPINPWEHTNKHIWFYDPRDLVPMESIVRYESARLGNLVIFPKSSGIVVKSKILNKPRFYVTCSWTCRGIRLLNSNGEGYIRFLPNRSFWIRRADDPIPPDFSLGTNQ